jgi:hypothetical protein
MHHIPGVERLFQIGDLSMEDCILTVLAGLVPVTVLEMAKLARRGATARQRAKAGVAA